MARSCSLSNYCFKRLSERRFHLQMIEAVDRLDVEALHLAFLQHIKRDAGARAPLRPHLAVKVGQILRLFAIDAHDDIAAFDAGLLRLTNSRPRSSSVLRPSHGRPGPDLRPAEIRSPRIGVSRSMGTNMLPGALSLPPTASPTTSEPTPTSLPSRLISAAPLQAGWGG